MNKTGLVTGGARGIGAEISRHLLDEGWDLIVHYNNSGDEARRLADNSGAKICGADLSQAEEVEALTDKVESTFESLDLLVNNAARFSRAALQDIDDTDWEDHMAVNARAPLFLTRRLTPLLRKNSGTIVNIVDWATRSPYPGYLSYMASKGALETLTRGLARSLAPEVRVNGIAPGPIEFPEDFPEKQKKKIIGKTLLQRQGAKKEIARAVLFLAEEATFTTGSILEVDGGRHVNS